MRIISTVPSQTELLADLELDQAVVGVTKFCVHPPHWRKNKVIIGGTKNLRIQDIFDLNPTLILANKEENDKIQIESLANCATTIVTEIKTLDDNRDLILMLGKITDRVSQAVNLELKYSQLVQKLKTEKSRSAAYLIWKEPLMSVGGDTFIHAMMDLVGFRNVFGESRRYPETDMEEIRERAPEYILLSSEPYPFGKAHMAYFSENFPESKVILVDGEAFSWYGSRLIRKFDYLKEMQSLL